jgi:hypothetical protein
LFFVFFFLSFSLGFSPRTRFFFHLFRDLLVLIKTIDPSKMGGARRRKGKTTKRKKNQKIHNNNNNASARKEENEEMITPAAMFSILSLSVSLRVCIYFIITKRELKMVSNYIFYAYVATTPRDQKSIGPRSLGVKLAPGSKIKKATAMHAKANVALDSSTSVTSSLGA